MAEPAMNFDTHKSIKALIERGFKEPLAEGIVEVVSISREQDISKLATKDQLAAVEEKLTDKINSVEEKLSSRIDAVEEKLSNRIDAVEEKLNNKIDSVETKLMNKITTEVATIKYDILKWMIPLFLTNTLAVLAVLAAFFLQK